MTDRNDPSSHDAADDAGLKRLLGVLKPPKPSELLRARVENAIHDAPPSASKSTPDAPPRTAPRRALYGRIAASVVLAAGIALGTWLPAPQPSGGTPVTVQLATGTGGSTGGTDFSRRQDVQDTGKDTSQESELGLALVGGGTPVTGIGLVHADWDSADSGTGTGFEETSDGVDSRAAFNSGSEFENVNFESGGSALSEIPLY